MKQKRGLIFLGTIIGLILFCSWQNNSIVVTSFTYENSKIPETFNGFRVVHISDLHNKEFGKGQIKLLKKIEEIEPAIIIVTGDLIDRRKFDLEIAMTFIHGAVEIAPTYYVSGNHEAWSGQYTLIKEQLQEAGVYVLDDLKVTLKRGESSIQILGLSDPDFYTSSYLEGTNSSPLEGQLAQWSQKDDFKLLLSHRPELFDIYSKYNTDLIFSGHAHGGQFRVPFVGGLIAPDQGLFPKYTSGEYTQGDSTLYVSRGLGNSIIPVRIFNRPQIIVVTLEQNK